MINGHARLDPSALLDPWCRTLLAESLRTWGVDPSAFSDKMTLQAALGATDHHSRLMDALVEMLAPIPTGDAETLKNAALTQAPGLRHHVDLAEHCIRGLPDILKGHLTATDHLFPGGATHRVESIYRNNPWADYFNQLTAKATAKAVAAYRAGKPQKVVRILEIGAGTGGTTGFVLKALSDFKNHFEYGYSDVSQGFVQCGKERFGAEDFQMEFFRLDIENPDPNRFPPADIVIATNVLHATRNIDQTLRHVRSLLVEGGLLLLNELTHSGPFATLTFGLLEGWWCFEDGDQRLPHSPILSAKAWRKALGQQAFGPVSVYGWNSQESGFQCLMLTSAIADRTPTTKAFVPFEAAARASDSRAARMAGDEAQIADAVRNTLARRLGFTSEEIDWQRPFGEIGLDSIVAPQLADDLSNALGIAVDTTDIYNYATVSDLSKALWARCPKDLQPSSGSRTERRTGPPSDAIAIVGMAGRFAGALDQEALWSLLREGIDSTGPVTGMRQRDLNLSLSAGLLPEAEFFDPDFFRIAHAEAEVMDPQQRVFLEECWHAFEDAGIGSERIDQQSCGIFVGVAAQNHPANQGESRAALGNSNAILAARMAYHLNLKGPAIAIDTACSSSLVAIHLAIESLRSGECDLALAGGVSVLLTSPALPHFLVDAGMVSPKGQCRAFDHDADGFVPGEGVGVLVLCRLDRALALGDRIHGVIRASGINQDGRTHGITAPSGPAQTALIRRVCAKAGITPNDLSYIEAHGTGTPLGDPIELLALTEVFGEHAHHQKVPLGSIKTNIGHTLTAAGVASVCKVLLALRAREIPPSVHFETPNPRLRLEQSPFYIPTHVTPWTGNPPLRASVSSFGFSGTNAFLIIEEAERLPPKSAVADETNVLLLLSAQREEAMTRMATRLADWLEAHPATSLQDLARTLNAGRFHLIVRKAFWVKSTGELIDALRAVAAGSAHPDVVSQGDLLSPPSTVRKWTPDDHPLALASHFVAGGAAEWHRLARSSGSVISLPGYPFERDPFGLLATPPTHSALLRGILPIEDAAFSHHQWKNRPVLPAAALIWLASGLIRRSPYRLRSVQWHHLLANDEARLTLDLKGQITLACGETLYAQAYLEEARPEDRPNLQSPLIEVEESTGRDLYAAFTRIGFDYGPLYRVIQGLQFHSGKVYARLDWPAMPGQSRHPEIALLDGMIQAALGLSDHPETIPSVVPVGLELAWIDPDALIPPLTVEVSEILPQRSPGERKLTLTAWNASGQIASFLDRLSIRQVSEQEADQSLVYRPIWVPTKTPLPATLPLQKRVLVFGDTPAWQPTLSTETTLQVLQGPSFLARDPGTYHVRPGDPNDLKHLAEALAERDFYPDMIVHAFEESDDDGRWAHSHAPLTLIHFLSNWLRLRNTTRQLVVIHLAKTESPAAFDQDPVLAGAVGLLQALALEEPHFKGKVIGLEREDDPLVPWLSVLEDATGGVEEFLEAGGQRYTRAYQPITVAPSHRPLPPSPVCLITGAFGGLGLSLAEHLWRRLKARLVLISRSPAPPEVTTVLRTLRAEGASIVEMQADVTDPQAVERMVSALRRQGVTPDRVFHLAGVQADGFLKSLSADVIDSVLRPKGTGLLNLMVHLEKVADWVVFGSLAGAFGAPGQAPYAAANRAMDALLERIARRKPQGRFLALDWGYWSQTRGMRTLDRDEASIEATTGLRGFLPAEGFQLLDAVLESSLQGRYLLAQGKQQAFEDFLKDFTLPENKSAATFPDQSLAYLTQLVAEITRTPIERLGADRPLEDFGIDSIMITRLNARLERDLGRISKTLFFEHTTLRSLAQHLAHHHPLHPSPEGTVEKPPAPARSTASLAIVGMAARLPMANDVNAYWKNLVAGTLCIEEIPESRWPVKHFFDPNPDHPGTSYSKWGGFISDVDRFDPLFFKISPEEAIRMDPQERLFLEVAWQAMEDGGFTRHDFGVAGSRRVGVFVGVMYGDYGIVAHDAAQGRSIRGAAPYWSIANRASYIFGFEGPSIAIDTACSSSLSALHLACQALITGECDAALVGGVNLSLHPDKYVGLSQGRFASSDGRCRSFTLGGDGYVPGDGVVAIFIKRQQDAVALSDQIHGLIRSTAINHGGRSNGYSVPNPNAQAKVITAALSKAGINADQIGYIEAHGTGTRLGDPIEIEGLGKALGLPPEAPPIPIGSAKAAIGHLEAAAGLAGLIKVLLQMRHSRFAAMPHLGPINDEIDFSKYRLTLQQSADFWPSAPNGSRYAGISSFGAGGANAHVIVESGPLRVEASHQDADCVIPLSGRTQADVRAIAGALDFFLATEASPPSLTDICHTLTRGRESFRCRCAFVAQNRTHLRTVLAAISQSAESLDVFWGEAPDEPVLTPVESAGPDLRAQAAHWCQGGTALWPHPGLRVSLAPRPFLGRRYWVPASDPNNGNAVEAPADWTALKLESSDKGMSLWRFTLKATSPLLLQHVVGGTPLLPGAAILSMALEIEPLGIQELTWIRPVAARSETVVLDFSVKQLTTGKSFEVRLEGHDAVVAQGLLGRPEIPPMVWTDPPFSGDSVEKEALYHSLKALGINYGERFQRIAQLHPGLQYTSATLDVNDAHIAPRDAAVIDAAFQVLAGLVPDWHRVVDQGEIPVPFALAAVVVEGDLGKAARVEAQRWPTSQPHHGRYALRILDREGHTLMTIGELTARGKPIAPPDVSATLLVPGWLNLSSIKAQGLAEKAWILPAPGAEDLAVDLARHFRVATILNDQNLMAHLSSNDGRPLYLLDTAEGIAENSPEMLKRWIESSQRRTMHLLHRFQTLQPLIEKGSIERVMIVTRGLQHIAEADDQSLLSSDAGGLLGLSKVAAREWKSIPLQLVDLPVHPTADDLGCLALEEGTMTGTEIAYRNGHRYRRQLRRVHVAGPTRSPVEAQETCLIIGGMGGIGQTLAEYFAREQAARVILVGRRAAGPVTERFIQKLQALGGDGLYLEADASHAEALERAVVEAESRFGPIQVVLHAALTLKDRALIHMTPADFEAAFAPRAAAAAALGAVFLKRSPRRVLLFSSANVFLGQPGQGNYVSGNTAMTLLGHALKRQGLPVQIIHWGLWGEVGAITDPLVQRRFQQEGIYPITPEIGITLFHQATSLGLEVAPIRLDLKILDRLGLVEAGDDVSGAPPTPGFRSSELLTRIHQTLPETSALVEALEAFKLLEQWGLQKIAVIFQTMAPEGQTKRYTPMRLLRDMGVTLGYHPFALTLLDRLRLGGFIEERDGLWQRLELKDPPYPDTLLTLELRYPWLSSQRRLLEACLAGTPSVLRGEQTGTSVLFPNGDSQLVEVAYQGNPISDRANGLLGAALVLEVSDRAARQPESIRILEVGAGTGGTTLPLLAALEPWKDRIRYRATDLSPLLATRLGQRCLAAGWSVETGVLDIAQPLSEGSELRFDLIVAANVVHATRDVLSTLTHLQQAIAPGGRLLLNELTAPADLGTLIFGLTPQWWGASDQARRVPGTPALSPKAWREVLEEAGWQDAGVFGIMEDRQNSSQSIITASARITTSSPQRLQKDVLMPENTAASLRPPIRLNTGSKTPSDPGGLKNPDHQATVYQSLCSIFSSVLGIEPNELRGGETFEHYGIESLSALEIRNRIAVDYPSVSSTLLFEYNTLDRLVAHLLGTHRVAPSAPQTTGAEPGDPPFEHPSGQRGNRSHVEPIAIIGFAGRFPGGETSDDFWQLILNGESALGPVPPDRWHHDDYLDNTTNKVPSPGRCRTQVGGFIQNIQGFDPLFFGISPVEAETMDPQERLFIEACWEAIEDAGTTPNGLIEKAKKTSAQGSVGVFCGVMNTGYQWLAAEAWRLGQPLAASSHFWSIANRVSYLFDFDGPSLAVDTACSASLTAVHLACDSLRKGECAAALVGGINLITHPRQLINLGQAGMTTQGRECRVFGAQADGFVDAEGVGVILIKRLSQALLDGDRIDGIITGSAINAGGKTSGFTVPNPLAQAKAVRAAFEQAGIEADGLCLIETHGTGTRIGDPIELSGLMHAFGDKRPSEPLPLGTLKANIGHLESAAGIASLIKVLLQLRHATIAPARHAGDPNPLIDWQTMPFRLPKRAEPWPLPSHRPRRAAISGFGAGGANAHLILEQYLEESQPFEPLSTEWIPVSARSPEQLRVLAERLVDTMNQAAHRLPVDDHPRYLADIGRTLREGRVDQANQKWIRADSLEALLKGLESLAQGRFDEVNERPSQAPVSHPLSRPISLPTSPYCRGSFWMEGAPTCPAPLDQRPSPTAIGYAGDSDTPTVTRFLRLQWVTEQLSSKRDDSSSLILIGGPASIADALRCQAIDVEYFKSPGERFPENRDHLPSFKRIRSMVLMKPDDSLPASAWLEDLTRWAGTLAETLECPKILYVADGAAAGDSLAEALAVKALLQSLILERPGITATVLILQNPSSEAILEELNGIDGNAPCQLIRRTEGYRECLLTGALPVSPSGPLSRFRQKGSYVVIGGLGEVGRALAKTLLQRYGVQLALMGRTPLNEDIADQLKALGPPDRVRYFPCDVTDLGQLEETFAKIAREQHGIDGVLHLARHVTPQPLHTMTRHDIRQTFNPKVDGSRALLLAIAPYQPDWIMLFSSLAAWAGQAGGAHYATACAYQDGLALERAQPVLSVAWPQWSHDRYLDPAKKDQWEALSLRTLDAEAGLDALEDLISFGPGAYGVLHGAEHSLDEIIDQFQKGGRQGTLTAWGHELNPLDDLTLMAYRDYLLSHRVQSDDTQPIVRHQAAEADEFTAKIMLICSNYLKISPEVLATASFQELGLDSIRALHLAERLQRQLHCSVEPLMLFEHPTIEQLSEALILATS